MRNILIHMYFGIDHEIVWAVVEQELPHLKAVIDAILGTTGAENNNK
ncbi:MAG: HepT-like ribonuclease domain-containing protein [Ktedonobacteraceae bacterium]